MKKYILIAFTFLASIAIAQNTGSVKQVRGKDVYVLSAPLTKTENVGKVILSSDEIMKSNSFENRFNTAITKQKKTDFDAVFTRDGKVFLLKKYAAKPNRVAKVISENDKDVYFFVDPTLGYEVVGTKPVTEKETDMVFLNLMKNKIHQPAVKDFDAIIIKDKTVEYISYKK